MLLPFILPEACAPDCKYIVIGSFRGIKHAEDVLSFCPTYESRLLHHYGSAVFSSLADNALLISAIALLAILNAPGWMTPLLKLFFVLSYVLLTAFGRHRQENSIST